MISKLLMHLKKITSVLALDGAARHAYFVRKVADTDCVWGLEQSGWAMAEDAQGRKVVPFWPEEEFAELCAQGSWRGYTPRKISLEDFLERWLPGMGKDGTLVAVFPKPDDRGIVVNPERLRSALQSERAQYE